MTRALLLTLSLTAAASAQVVADAPPPAPVLGLSDLDCSAGAVALPGEILVPPNAPLVPEAPGVLVPVPMPRVVAPSAAAMPNVCRDAAPLAVLPEGVRFRTDPLPPSADDDPGRQLLRELEAERLRLRVLPYDPNDDRFHHRLGRPELERLPLPVAPPAHRP